MAQIKFKDVYPWIITVSALIGIWQFIVPRAKDMLEFKNNVSFELVRVYDFGFVGGLLGNFRFKADIKVTNPTNADVLFKKPYIKAYLNQTYIGETEPSSENIKITPNASTDIKQLQINVPLLNMGNFIQIFTNIKNKQQTGKIIRLDVRTEINGYPVEKQIEYQV